MEMMDIIVTTFFVGSIIAIPITRMIMFIKEGRK